MTTQDFIKKATVVHGNRYDYSKSEYRTTHEKLCIICPEHGEFWQAPAKHLNGQGCPMCSGTRHLSTEEWIGKAVSVHGDRYDYSKAEYVNNKTKLCIICPEHGEFWQTPHNHLKGKGCPECGKGKVGVKKYDTDSFIVELKRIYGDRYNYSKTNYTNIKEKTIATCPKHGDFVQTAEFLLKGGGCPKCSYERTGEERRFTTDEFINKSTKMHGVRYDYSESEYITANDRVAVICPVHGKFWQTAYRHMSGCGCPKCTYPYSKPEKEIFDFVKTLVGDENVVENNRTILSGQELDIYIPSVKVAIEYNGLYWHTKEKRYHLNKLDKCNKLGIRLLQIFEDEYIKHKDIVFGKIRHILGKDDVGESHFGRKCYVSEISVKEAESFLEKNHIQGYGRSTVRIGAFHGDILVGVMCFKKEHGAWELVRFATLDGCRCPGVGGKLFSHFINTYNPITVKSFADRRWTTSDTDNLYTKLGFTLDCTTGPEYRYYRPQDGPVRRHKFGFRKDKLSKEHGFVTDMTETQMTEALGYRKIWDCGLLKYVWRKDT